MKRRNIALWALAAAALMFAVPQALAQTAAGTKVRNHASITYKVGGVTQSSEPVGETDFLVDRRVDLTVSALASSYSATPGDPANPGDNKSASFFTVTNNTNDVIDVALTASNLAAATETAGLDGLLTGPLGTEDDDNIFSSEANTAGLTLWYDDGATAGVWDSTDTEVTKDGANYYIEEMAAGANATIMVVADSMPDLGDEADNSTVQDADTVAVSLTAEARTAYASPDGSAGLTWPSMPLPGEDAVAGQGAPTWVLAGTGLGAAFTETTTNDATKVETVFADSDDTDSPSDTGDPGDAGNGQDAAYTLYEISAAAITVTKKSVVYWDPINLFSNPKAIPGAVVLYCVNVENATGSPTATAIAISDVTPENTTFEEGQTDTDGDATNGVDPLDPDGAAGTTYPALAATNSIRFSTAATCTAADWDGASTTPPTTGSSVEDSDALTEDTTAFGSYTAGTKTISTTVDSLAGGESTTTMFLVKID